MKWIAIFAVAAAMVLVFLYWLYMSIMVSLVQALIMIMGVALLGS